MHQTAPQGSGTVVVKQDGSSLSERPHAPSTFHVGVLQQVKEVVETRPELPQRHSDAQVTHHAQALR